jgi:hypothetical protein
MNTFLEDKVAAAWVRLGVMLNVAAANETPDVERLLLDTVRVSGGNTRLFILAAGWLSNCAEYVAGRRLSVLVAEELEEEFRPVMGFLLEWVQLHSHRNRSHFREAIRHCRPAVVAGPLADVSRRNAILHQLASDQASELSRKWGCWLEEFEIKSAALRPVRWIARENPVLSARAICGGDLVASILAEAGTGTVEFDSESHLARRYRATRAGVRDALRKLELSGHALQGRKGRRHPITVTAMR